MSNKTPKKPLNETESALKRPDRSLKKLLFGVILLSLGSWAIYSGVSSLFDNTLRLLVPNGFINVEVVDTPESRQLGLSGRTSISDSAGMLFVFDLSSEAHCLVMRDMQFSIDMVWMNDNREVVTVTPNVTPETYPEIFCPDSPAKYALELSNSNAEKLGIVPGEKLRW
jgi:uncharacterized membrane protein (UPF0127 family)